MGATDNTKGSGLLTYADLVARLMRDFDAAMERRKWSPMTRKIVGEVVFEVLRDNGDPFAEIGDAFGPPGGVDPS